MICGLRSLPEAFGFLSARPESRRGAYQAEAEPASAVRSQLQILRKASKFLVDRLRRMEYADALRATVLIVLSYGRTQPFGA